MKMKASATFQMPVTNGRKRNVKMISRKQKLGIVENGEGKQKDNTNIQQSQRTRTNNLEFIRNRRTFHNDSNPLLDEESCLASNNSKKTKILKNSQMI